MANMLILQAFVKLCQVRAYSVAHKSTGAYDDSMHHSHNSSKRVIVMQMLTALATATA